VNPEQAWQHTVSIDGDHTTIVLAGEWDMSSAAHLRNLLTMAVRMASVVTVDIGAVSFIDSTTITAFVNARNAAAATGCRFTLVNPARQVHRVLQVTGVLDMLTATPPSH
jgi:anti-sigma B factor antagonist